MAIVHWFMGISLLITYKTVQLQTNYIATPKRVSAKGLWTMDWIVDWIHHGPDFATEETESAEYIRQTHLDGFQFAHASVQNSCMPVATSILLNIHNRKNFRTPTPPNFTLK